MNKVRQATKERKSKETSIRISVNLDGTGVSTISTGIGFFDHMLTLLSKYSFIDMSIEAQGDLQIDSHHTVEDVAIVLGDCLDEAFKDKAGIKRYGFFGVPMDETLVISTIDLSGRPYLNFNASFTTDRLGTMESEMIEEFFRTLSVRLKMNCHIEVRQGKNNHHIAEGIFKAFGKSLDEAKTIDPRIKEVLSTKGLLD